MVWKGATAVLVSVAVAGLCGCSAEVSDFADKLQPISVASTPANVIEWALAYCGAKTESAETACVKKSLKDSAVSPTRLASIVPGCRIGKQCHYDYTTDDQVGFFKPTASDFVVHWHVSFDLRKTSGTIDEIPISVVETPG